MISLSKFPVIEPLKNLPEVTSIIAYGGLARGDKETKDADFLVFTAGKNYVTPLSPFEKLLEYSVDPNETDVYIHSDEEPYKILCRLHKPSSFDHVVSNGKVVFCRGEDPLEILKSKKNIWYDVAEKLKVRTHHLLELSDELASVRTGYLWIRMLIPERRQFKGNNEKSFRKTVNKIRGTAVMREGLAINGILLGKADDGKNITNKFFDVYSSIESYRKKALEIRDFETKEHRKFSDEELEDIVGEAKEIGEVSVHAIDEKLQEKFLKL